MQSDCRDTMTLGRHYLVIVSCGDNLEHLLASNVFAPDRLFDICLNYYGKDLRVARALESESDFFFSRQGSWIENLYFILNTNLPSDYRYIMKMDDDIVLDSRDIDRLFSLTELLGLTMTQPAFADENLTYKLFKAQEGVIARHTPFIETQVPVFEQRYMSEVVFPLIREYIEEFGFKSGWGLDLVWSDLAGDKNMAVVDACVALHTRPTDPQGSYYDDMQINPFLEAVEFCEEHNIACSTDGSRWLNGTLYTEYKKPWTPIGGCTPVSATLGGYRVDWFRSRHDAGKTHWAEALLDRLRFASRAATFALRAVRGWFLTSGRGRG